MKIVYQGTEVETGQTSVAGFLSERQVDVAKAIVEYVGEVYAPGTDLAALELKVADLAADARLLQKTQEAAAGLLARDAAMGSLPALRRRVDRLLQKMSL